MPKIVDVQQYRQELLGKCFNLFAQKGYANVTTRQIAQELKVSTGTLYHYFSNKQVLFEQLVEYVSLRDVDLLKNIDKDRSIVQRLYALGRLLIEEKEYIIKQTAIWLDFRQHSASQIDKNIVFWQAEQRYQQAIAQLLDLEDLQIAKFIWASIDGICLDQIDNHDSSAFDIQIELLVEMLIAYFEKYNLV